MRRRKWFIVGGIVATLLSAYALAGFVWLPRYVESTVRETFARDYARQVEITRPSFNPFTFEFEARAWSVPDADGERMLGFDRLYVDFELSSLWRGAWTFGSIALERPYLKVVQRVDGSLNLAELASRSASDEPGHTELSDLAIGELSVSEGRVDVQDRMRERPFVTTLFPVTFGLTEFRSTGSGNAYSFTAGSDRSGRLALDGSFGLAPFRSSGTFALTGLPATTVSEYLGELLPVRFLDGRIDLRVGYDLSLAGRPFMLVLDLPAASARELASVAPGYEEPWRIPALDLRGARIDVAARRVEVAAIEIANASAPIWLDAEGTHLPGVRARLPTTAIPPEPAATEDGELASGATRPGWQVAIAEIRLANAAIALEDRRMQPVVAHGVTVEELRVGGFALPQEEPLAIAARLRVQSGGELSLDGTLGLAPLAMAAELTTTDMELRAGQPYLAGTDLRVLDGRLTSRGRVEYAEESRPRLRYRGDVTIARLHTRDGTLNEDFINWSALDVRGLEFTQEPTRLAIAEIVAKEPYLRLVLAASGVSNVQFVLDPEGAARRAAEIAAERAERAAGTKKGDDDDEPDPESPPAPEAPAKPRPPARIGTVRIANGNVNFSDFTLAPAFQIAIERLDGTITGMTSSPGDRARVELTGEVDRYAPAQIGGELNLLAAQSYLDITADFRNIELTSFNPYSGKFAGYRIDKGKLSIDTRYRVENRRLDASHHFVLDQLQLGERVDSPDAVSLPLKLAVALLKDRNGVIDIDLPVTGSLDEPKFRLGPIVWKAVLNLLGKIVTSPFALLGKLFGGGADLSEVAFAPGSATPDAASLERLTALKQALIERPGLSIDVPSSVDPAGDRKALEDARWSELLAGQATDDRKAYRDRLVELHREKLGRRPDLPKPPKAAAGEPEVDPVEHAISLLEAPLREALAVGDADLAALGQARSEAVRDALLADGSVDPARVFLIRGEPAAAADGSVRMVLTLK